MQDKKTTDIMSVYVVDDEFKIISFNDVLEQIYPDLKVGGYCYEQLCHEKEPCKDCPVLHRVNEGSIFYNRWLQQWINVKVGTVPWPGHGICHVLMANNIMDDDKNLLYNLTRMSPYDELLELNLTKNTFKTLYHEEGKYQIPENDVILSEMLQEARETLIHPQDWQEHEQFWNLDTMGDRLEKAEPSGMLRARFREKRVDGSWCWVEHLLANVKISGVDDQIVMCFISEIQEYKEELSVQMDLEKQERNSLTGLYNESAFFYYAERYLCECGEEQQCLVAIDIEHFKLFNEWYGRKAGDEFLISIGSYLNKINIAWGGIAGHFGGDNFAMLMPYRKGLIYYLNNQITGTAKKFGDNAGFFPVFGVYLILNKTMSLENMYDRATIALVQAKDNYATRLCEFHPSMIYRMEEEQHLLSQIQNAFERKEFTFYLQPQYNIEKEKIIGAEALMRWKKSNNEIVFPEKFLPILEKNGFIAKLDKYIWEEVCHLLRFWLNQGIRPVPISVNVSRMDIYSFDVAAYFKKLIKKYQLDSDYIKIEITESAYVQEFEIMTKAVTDLKEAGFKVLMDDFGSGYSSLNMLKNMNIDILKLDMRFLHFEKDNLEKGVNILESVVSMARLLAIPVIAEGVETEEQLQILRNMKCRYAQGYYYSRPLSQSQFTGMLQDEEQLDFEGFRSRSRFIPDKEAGKNLLEKEDRYMKLLHKYLPDNIFLFQKEGMSPEFQVIANGISKKEGFSLGEYEKQLNERLFTGRVTPEEENRIRYEMREAEEKGEDYHTVLSFYNEQGEIIWVSMDCYHIDEEDVKYMCIVRDITERKEQENQRNLYREKLEKILELEGINSWEWDISNNRLLVMNAGDNERLRRINGKLGEKRAVISDFPECIMQNLCLEERDRQKIKNGIERIFRGEINRVSDFEIHLNNDSGESAWILVQGEVIYDENHFPVRMFGSYVDITDEKKIERESQQNMKILELLRSQAAYDFEVNLTQNTLVGGKGRQQWQEETGCYEDTFSGMIEYIAEHVIATESREAFLTFADRNRLLQIFDGKEHMESIDYERNIADNSRWMRMIIHIDCFNDENDIIAYLFVTDIDEQKKQELRLTAMAETDALTGLYNRHRAVPEMEKYLTEHEDETSALIMIDLDNLKQTNDTFGHAYGDTMILTMAKRIKNHFREEDIVSRFGGDEFLILCKNISRETLERKLKKLVQPVVVTSDNKEYSSKFTLSAGYVMIEGNTETLNELYQKADHAMFEAKKKGKSSYAGYDVSTFQKESPASSAQSAKRWEIK